MDNYGIVYGIEGNKAIVLTMDRRFVAIKISVELCIGQQIKFDENEQVMYGNNTDDTLLSSGGLGNWINTRKIPVFAGIAAAVLIVFLLIQFSFFSKRENNGELVYMDIDTEASIGMVIDNRGVVRETKAINKDAETMLASVELDGTDYRSAVEIIAGESEKMESGSNKTALISGSLNQSNEEYRQNKEHVEQKMNEILKTAGEIIGKNGNTVKTVIVPYEIRDDAVKNNMSMGRYAAYVKARSAGIDITMETLREIPINKVLDKVEIGEMEFLKSVGSTPAKEESGASDGNPTVTKRDAEWTPSIAGKSGNATNTPAGPKASAGSPNKAIRPTPVIAPSSNSKSTLKGLIAWYKFDEDKGVNVVDSSGNGNTGTLCGTASITSCKTGKALSLDGTDGYVELPTGILKSVKEITVALWVKVNSDDRWFRIFDFGKGTKYSMYLTPRANDSSRVRLSVAKDYNDKEERLDGSSALQAGVWKHVAVTISGNTGVVYINGVENGRNSDMNVDLSDLGYLTNNYIGKSLYDNNRGLNGQIDDFRIYKRALKESEIKEIIAEGNPGGSMTAISAFDRIEAENFDDKYGSVKSDISSDGEEEIETIENGDFVVYDNVDFGSRANEFEICVSSAAKGGNIEIRVDSVDSLPIGIVQVSNTGSWESWKTKSCTVSRISGKHKLYLKFTGGKGNLFKINWFRFN